MKLHAIFTALAFRHMEFASSLAAAVDHELDWRNMHSPRTPVLAEYVLTCLSR